MTDVAGILTASFENTGCGVYARSTVSDDLIGRVIDDRYRIDAEIGDGAMGIVYRCHHVRLGKDLAIKVLRRERGRSEELIGRFLKEARLASSLKHANVVDLSDCGEMPEGGAYYVMELLNGEALAETLERDRRVEPRRSFDIALQITAGLRAAHAREIVHRDLKPENVFLCPSPAGLHVKLLDFGIAKAKDSKDTLPGTVLGTPEYMAPEQARGAEVDTRADLYALGVMLFEMLSGRVPLYAEAIGELLRLKLQGTPLLLRQGAPDLAHMTRTEELITQLLEREPAHRVQTIDEVHRLLIEARDIDLDSKAPEAKHTQGIGSGKVSGPVVNTAHARAVDGGWQRPGTQLPSVGAVAVGKGLTVPVSAAIGAAAVSGAAVATAPAAMQPPVVPPAAPPPALSAGTNGAQRHHSSAVVRLDAVAPALAPAVSRPRGASSLLLMGLAAGAIGALAASIFLFVVPAFSEDDSPVGATVTPTAVAPAATPELAKPSPPPSLDAGPAAAVAAPPIAVAAPAAASGEVTSAATEPGTGQAGTEDVPAGGGTPKTARPNKRPSTAGSGTPAAPTPKPKKSKKKAKRKSKSKSDGPLDLADPW